MEEIGIFGLGSVGSAVAKIASESGLEVVGVDVNSAVVDSVNSNTYFQGDYTGISATTDGREVASSADAILICVPTPLNTSQVPNLEYIEEASKEIAEGVAKNSETPLVVVESTVPPGTTRNVVYEQFKNCGCFASEEFYLGYVPERVDPGSDSWPIESIPRVVGAVTGEGLQKVQELYKNFINAELHVVESVEVAESAKVVENSFRDVNIAFVNEIALSLEQLGIDVVSVLDAAETKPFGFMRFSPGAGVGGDCIPTDPYHLINESKKNGIKNRLMEEAREINDVMPKRLAYKTIKSLNETGNLPLESDVLLLGRSFKPNIRDDTNSPYFDIKQELEEFGVTVSSYDPHFSDKSTYTSPYADVDAVVLVTGHNEFRDLRFDEMAQKSVDVFVDGRAIYDANIVEQHDLFYTRFGY